jgi:amidophosphoribosyltransferase
VSYTDLELDKLHEECGVFGIYSHKEDVPLNIYWGLYALQHRGQESCGIAVSDGKEMQIKLGMGLVPDVFKDGVGDSVRTCGDRSCALFHHGRQPGL